jgi:hypothetical protein
MIRSHHLQPMFALLLFSLWLLGILAMQINIVCGLAAGRNLRWLTFWSRWDVLHICPNFAFFSRLPIVHYHILIRDQLLDHEFAAWRLIVLPKRSIINAFWNPGRRRRFGIEDACRSLITHLSKELEKGGDPVCLAFLCLLNYAAAQPRSPFARARQFMIATVPSLGTKGSTPIFVSPLFVLDLDSATGRRSEIEGESLVA